MSTLISSPNCKISEKNELVSIRAIGVGEEITYSYFELPRGDDWEATFAFKCECNSSNCVSNVQMFRPVNT
jgi:SET domain-containing protein